MQAGSDRINPLVQHGARCFASATHVSVSLAPDVRGTPRNKERAFAPSPEKHAPES
jgi:hypothetical protein